MSGRHDIDEGYTQDFLVHGIFVLIAAGIALLVHWSLTALLLGLAVALFRVRSGIEIDVEGRKARVYKAMLHWKFGEWVDAKPYASIELRYTNESQVMNYQSISTNVRVRTYGLILLGPGDRKLSFHDFTDYAKARKSAAIMAEGWAWALEDDVQRIRARARENDQHRRR